MRVLFDGYWWSSGPISNSMVQRQIIETWHALFPADELFVAVPYGDGPLAGNGLPGVTYVRTRLGRPQVVLNVMTLGRIARAIKADAVVAHNFAPIARRGITFIHDLMFLDHPEWFTPLENLYFRLMGVLARATRTQILTSSRAEAARITRHLRRPATPIGLGTPLGLRRSGPLRPKGLPTDTFLLAVGRLNIRKNLGNIIDGAIASGALSAEMPLVVVGERSGRAHRWTAGAQAAMADGRVILLGPTSDGELRWLYEHARAFIMLSLDEGFGLPVAEALEFGLPVVASDIDVFRGEFGAHVSLVDPTDVDSIAREIAIAMKRPRREARILYEWDDVVRSIRLQIEGAT